jgi:hypothetical protein
MDECLRTALAGCLLAMKKILIVTAVFVFILLLAEIANQVPPPAPAGYDFWLYAQQVVECSPTEITLVDNHQTEIHLEKDEKSWPPCASFHKGDVRDFYLSRGEKTHYLRDEPTAWWRKAM